MKKLKYFSAMLFLFSCTVPGNNDHRYTEAFQQNKIDKSHFIVVVPGAGCGGCISEATYFLVKNYDNMVDGVTIVFTGVNDRKLLKNEVGEHFLSKPNVKIDKDNYFLAPEIASNYPQVITFKERSNEIEDIKNFDQNTYNSIIH